MEPISDHGLQLIDLGVDFPKGGKPEDPEKNRGTRRKTGESGGKPGTRRKTLQARERATTTTLLTRVPSFENQQRVINPSGWSVD